MACMDIYLTNEIRRLSPYVDYMESGDSNPEVFSLNMAKFMNEFGILLCDMVDPRMTTARKSSSNEKIFQRNIAKKVKKQLLITIQP